MKFKLVMIMRILLIAALIAACLSAIAQQKKTENVVIVTLDGYRWRELFTGADKNILKRSNYVTDTSVRSKFWDNNCDTRRKKLMPFFWNVIARDGQLYGNRKLHNKMKVSNGTLYSYSGYSEMFVGFHDKRVDDNDEILNPNFTVLEAINQSEAFCRYYELTREMLINHTPDILGHMDKIKIQNIGDKLFSEQDLWYRNEIDKTIAAIKASGVTVEINTRGIYQKKSATTYPSPWIIEKLFQYNVPVTMSSDAHHPKDLTNSFEETAAMLASIGYKTIRILYDGKWRSIRFNEHGLLF